MEDRQLSVPGLPWGWGVTADDLTHVFPCAELLAGPVRSLYRAIDVDASADLAYRWLCQMRVAPYSYDLIDNLGKRSAQTLTPGADDLEVGMAMMVFRITSFEPGVHFSGLTLPQAEKLYGKLAVTYLVVPRGETASRIVVRIDAAKGGLLSRFRSWLLGWGDLVMMRTQLLNLKALAERDQAAFVTAAA